MEQQKSNNAFIYAIKFSFEYTKYAKANKALEIQMPKNAS